MLFYVFYNKLLVIKAKYFVVEPYYIDDSILSEIVYLDMLDNILEILYYPLSIQLFKNKLIVGLLR